MTFETAGGSSGDGSPIGKPSEAGNRFQIEIEKETFVDIPEDGATKDKKDGAGLK